ncbi:MAG: NAD-dependent epimerase/dehydratase family protein [Planctomycetota bacterium]
MTTRRSFLAGAAGAAATVAFASPRSLASRLVTLDQPKKLRVLFLGGTGFLGPHMVRYAVERGHEVTLFNRGRSGPDMFPDLTNLVGDRYGDISALNEGEWDVVIDTFTYVPSTVRRTVDLLANRVGLYVVVSTISVYGNRAEIDMDEDAELQPVPQDVIDRVTTHREVGAYYGGFKALCEQTADEGMGGRALHVRPGLIVGPRDPTPRFTYWPVRVRDGGEVLAPGAPGHYTQVIDVRDLAEFVVEASEKGLRGPYNAVSEPRRFTMGSMLEACKMVSESDAEFVWADADFLASQGIQAWGHMPAWVPPTMEGYEGFGQTSVKRAIDAGLRIRPIGETAAATLEWYDGLERQMAFALGRDQERAAIEAWKAQSG